MDKLIKVGKTRIILLVILIVLLGCNIIKRSSKSYESVILLGSAFDNENCTLSINDSLIFQNRNINTERSWGIDPNISIKLHQKDFQIKIKMSCDAKFEISDGHNVSRNVKIDTLIDLRRGRNILIAIRGYSIDIGQSKKKIILN